MIQDRYTVYYCAIQTVPGEELYSTVLFRLRLCDVIWKRSILSWSCGVNITSKRSFLVFLYSLGSYIC